MTRVAAAVVAVVALTGCGSEKDARRGDVNDYIARVNSVQHDAIAPWDEARVAYTTVGRKRLSDRQLHKLAEVPLTIRTLRRRIAAVETPEDAKPLRARLLRLLDMRAGLAVEVNTFARYVNAVTPLQQRVADNTVRLRRALKQAHQRGPEQQALTSYAAQLAAVGIRLRRLHPPGALAPWHAEQVARLAKLRSGARTASRGLAAANRTLVLEGVDALTAAASAPVTVAERAAVLAYNARVRKIQAAAAAVEREQRRLGQALA